MILQQIINQNKLEDDEKTEINFDNRSINNLHKKQQKEEEKKEFTCINLLKN